MTTKTKIAEQILRRLNKFNDDSDIDLRELMLSVEQKLASLVRRRYFESKVDDVGYVDGSLVNTFRNLSLTEDSDFDDEYYVAIPANIPDLPYGLGLKAVGPMGDHKTNYVPVPNGFLDIYNGLDASSLQGQIGYYLEGGNIRFVNMSAMNKPKKIFMKIVLGISSVDEDQVINIPQDMVDEVVNLVWNDYVQEPPTDEVNDSIDKA